MSEKIVMEKLKTHLLQKFHSKFQNKQEKEDIKKDKGETKQLRSKRHDERSTCD